MHYPRIARLHRTALCVAVLDMTLEEKSRNHQAVVVHMTPKSRVKQRALPTDSLPGSTVVHFSTENGRGHAADGSPEMNPVLRGAAGVLGVIGACKQSSRGTQSMVRSPANMRDSGVVAEAMRGRAS